MPQGLSKVEMIQLFSGHYGAVTMTVAATSGTGRNGFQTISPAFQTIAIWFETIWQWFEMVAACRGHTGGTLRLNGNQALENKVKSEI